MQRFLAVLSLAVILACASARGNTDYDPDVTPLPTVEVENYNFYTAAVYANDRKLGEVTGSTGHLLFTLKPEEIPGSQQITFRFVLVETRQRMTLPLVQYRVGQRMHVIIHPNNGPNYSPTNSTAWE